MTPEEIQVKAVAALQAGMALKPDFWACAAETAGVPEEAFIDAVKSLKESGKLKRVGAVLKHGAAGFTHNVMLALRVPESRVEEAGLALAAFDFVSHCYEREVPPEFPFNLFAMIHARCAEEEACFLSMAMEAAKPEESLALRTLREVKKESMNFVR